MGKTGRKFAINACAAAVGCALSLGALGQSAERFADQNFQGGLNRAVRQPLEIIWLQSEIQADMWRHPYLAGSIQGCDKAGSPKEGCAVSVRSSWRYTFDANSTVLELGWDAIEIRNEVTQLILDDAVISRSRFSRH